MDTYQNKKNDEGDFKKRAIEDFEWKFKRWPYFNQIIANRYKDVIQ